MAVSDVIESVAAELMACVVVIDGADLGSKHVIEKRKTTIGSASTNDIHVKQEPASKTFVVLTLGPRGVDLKNAGSGIGIWVDDEPVDGVIRLRDGNLIRVGRTIFKYLTNERSQEDGYHEAMYRLLTTDELTQVFNRSYVTDALEREIPWARRTQQPLSLVMLDVDHLKRCNDTFGQRAGDHVLREVTRLVRERSREGDVVGRYRDDELAILLPGLDVQGAIGFAEATREAIERHRIEHEGRHVAITVSAGVVELELHIATGDALVDVADERLRRAKESGRNRVVSSNDGGTAAAEGGRTTETT
jgi:diguanylate cyclase (GGDEF)-like protein